MTTIGPSPRHRCVGGSRSSSRRWCPGCRCWLMCWTWSCPPARRSRSSTRATRSSVWRSPSPSCSRQRCRTRPYCSWTTRTWLTRPARACWPGSRPERWTSRGCCSPAGLTGRPAGFPRADASWTSNRCPGAASVALAEVVTEETPLPPLTVETLVARAGGHPLFLRELVRAAERGDPWTTCLHRWKRWSRSRSTAQRPGTVAAASRGRPR